MLSSTLMTSFEMFIYDPLDISVLQPERYLLDFSPVIISHIETVPGMRSRGYGIPSRRTRNRTELISGYAMTKAIC